MNSIPVIAIFDVGRTNKKLFLFDEQYNIVFERSARFTETVDEDGEPCENVDSLRLSIFDSLREVFRKKEFDIKAVNFSGYGATIVNIDEEGNPVTPLHSYLKPYPQELSDKFYEKYGGRTAFTHRTASPVLGSLNSAMQIYRLKKEKPEVFAKIKYSLHLPQYLSYLITGLAFSDLTSVGCHTNLWDFQNNGYHPWVKEEGILEKLAPLHEADEVVPAAFPGTNYVVGIGLHDSSAALIPYLVNFHEPFVLISTGTWCISLNPFNETPLTTEQLDQDCLCYLTYKGNPVKASRLFAGHDHELEVKRLAARFDQPLHYYRNVDFDLNIINKLAESSFSPDEPFSANNLSAFDNYEEAYHALMMEIATRQKKATQLVLDGGAVKRIFVDGGFSKNPIYMNLLALNFPEMEIFAASMAQATAVGTALAIHHAWNSKALPNDIVELKYYSVRQDA
ncbi:FGGY family carbohydrate kinase [Danxiaibacter flavus]|uniref:FGGY family carbohydrate kinase n=1 Tax=Danxiaibacter flavus TaxID=3049108 RepID=A0ABV3Z8K9_9BACT|nr:FGGY family carbohydrate kinase [Chitinophagaceae bacterium DXS]